MRCFEASLWRFHGVIGPAEAGGLNCFLPGFWGFFLAGSSLSGLQRLRFCCAGGRRLFRDRPWRRGAKQVGNRSSLHSATCWYLQGEVLGEFRVFGAAFYRRPICEAPLGPKPLLWFPECLGEVFCRVAAVALDPKPSLAPSVAVKASQVFALSALQCGPFCFEPKQNRVFRGA